MKKISSFLYFLSLSTSLFLGAKTLTKNPSSAPKKKKESLLESYEKLMRRSPVMEIKFEEKIYRKTRNKTITKKGKAYLENKSFRWEVGAEAWIYNGKDLYQYDEKNKYAIHYKAMDKKRELDDLVEMITDLKALQKKYTPTRETQNGDTLKVSLKNKFKGEVETLDVTLRKRQEKKTVTETVGKKQVKKTISKNYVVMSELVLNYRGGNRTTFAFDSFSYLGKSDASRLKIPAGVKIKEF